MTRRPRNGKLDSRGLSSSGLRMIGLTLIVLGLVVTFLAMTGDVEDGRVNFVFPFVFTNVGGWGMFTVSLLLFAFFILSSLLPWYLISRRGRLDSFIPFRQEWHARSSGPDTMEYIITTELPDRLRRRVYIEAADEEIRLRSTEDEAFLRSYSLPEGFEVEEIDYDYEGSYLVLKLSLIRVSGM